MKKLFSFALMATALLISGQVKAAALLDVNDGLAVAEVTISGQAPQYAEALEDAFAAVNGQTATIKLLQPACDVDGKVIGITNGTKVDFDLNGKTVTFKKGHIYIENGNLNITGEGNFIYTKGSGTYTYSGSDKNYRFLQLKGSKEDVAHYSVVTFGPKVNVDMYGFLAQIDNGDNTPYIPNNKKITNAQGESVAYGAEIHVYCYAITNYGVTILGTVQQTGTNLPLIYVHPGATLKGGVYCAGYGIYKIEGATIMDSGDLADECIPVYIKAGIVEITDSKIIATAPYKEPTKDSSGSDASGSAIVIDSHAGYTNNYTMDITISGDCEVVSSTGYAIQEVVTEGEEKYAKLEITGGNFVGGEKGTISVEPEYETYIKEQGSIKGGIYDEDITKYVNAANTVITYVDTEEGQKWTLGNKPSDEWEYTLVGAQDGDYVQLKSAAPTVEVVSTPTKIAYLAILNANKVIVDGTTLEVGEVVINEDAQLVIKANARLIVRGKQGIISTSTDNLIIEANNESNGMLLIDPLITFNTKPMATVELAAYSWSKDASDYAYQRFAIPTGGTLESVESEDNVSVGFYKYNGVKWVSIGFLNPLSQSYSPLDLDQLNEPFTYYQMIVNSPTSGKKITFKGRLAGNTSPKLTMPAGQEWIGFANSYMGKVDNDKLIEALGKSVYRCTSVGNHKYQWDPVSDINLEANPDLKVMEAFMINAEGQAIELQLDYKTMIWDYNTK